jgi:hypothetical protein
MKGELFLQQAVGSPGFNALAEAAATFPALTDAILPRVCLAWLDVARGTGYEGPIPGTNALVKSGYLHAQGVSESLENVLGAASLLMVEVGGDTVPLPEEFSPKLLAKLSKHVELLTKRTLLESIQRWADESASDDEDSSTESSEESSEDTEAVKTDAEGLEKVDMPGKAAAPRAPLQPLAPKPQQKQQGLPPKA